MKDIFIDNNIAKDFSTPINPNYKDLIKWVLTFNDTDNDAYLVLSKKLLTEYVASAQNCIKSTSMPIIIDKLTKEGMINSFTNDEMKAFISKTFKAKIVKKLRSNNKDRFHIPIVLLSNRKIVITKDINFTSDLVNFPKYTVQVSSCPSLINYT
jgi:hypothetical protein